MFECQICGLLSLGGTACPACGSQLRTDLTKENLGDEVLPTEVPGLDDAAAAWYDLEGMEPPEEEPEEQPSSPSTPTSSLPFGFQGESNVYDSRLPFGIGSFASGIPFDANNTAQVSTSTESTAPSEPSPAPPPESSPPQAPSVPEPVMEVPETPPLPEEPAPEPLQPTPDPAAQETSELPNVPELPDASGLHLPASPSAPAPQAEVTSTEP
ncbi:MAG: hypothetical protein ACPG9E_01745, partial [Poseidonia sp.]